MKNQHYQHLTIEQRIGIQECLSHGMSFKDIAKRIGKDQTTVSREVKRHVVIKSTSVNRTSVEGSHLNEPCKLLLKAPFVCNPCKHRHRICAFDKHVYSARDAHKAYESNLRAAREGIPLNKESFYENDRIITEGIRSGQHLYHVLKTHNLSVSIPTVYRHLKKGNMSVSAVEFPRLVKFKPRAHAYAPYVPKASKVGRTYADFKLFKEQTSCTAWLKWIPLSVGSEARLSSRLTLHSVTLCSVFCSRTKARLLFPLQSLRSKNVWPTTVCLSERFSPFC